MANITQKQLIESLQQMKGITPRKEWVSLLKSQVLAEKNLPMAQATPPAEFASIRSVFSQNRMAYSFAVTLLLVAGVFGFARFTLPGDALFPVKELAEQSEASLTGQTAITQNVVALNSRINDLAEATKEGKTQNVPSAINEVKTNAKNLTQTLKTNPAQNSATIKEIASSLKTLADVPGTDLSANSDVQNLYQTVVQNQITDLQKTTLTDAQKKNLTDAQALYAQGKYADALEELLLISN